MHGLLSSHTPHPRLLYTYGPFPTPPTRSGNLGRIVILTSFLVCTVLHQRNELLKSNNKFQINNHGQDHKICYYIMLSFHNKNHCIRLDRVQYSYLFNFEPKHFKHCYVGYFSQGGVTMLKTFFPQISPFQFPVVVSQARTLRMDDNECLSITSGR